MGNNQSVEEIDELTAEKLGLWYHDGYSPRPAKATLPRAFDSNASLLSAYSSHSSGTSEPWGWFTEDVEYRAGTKGVSDMAANQAAVQVTDEEEKAKVDKIAEAKDSGSGAKGDSLRDKREEKDFSLLQTLSLPSPHTAPPQYVLESSIEYQHLWYSTAGRRPKQPETEREYFHNLWKENFRNSEVNYDDSDSPSSSKAEAIMQTANASLTHSYRHNGAESKPSVDLETGITVLYTASHPNSYSVSKSFVYDELAAMSLSIPKFRVVQDEDELYAEFLVEISVCAQGAASAVLFGSWRRYSQFRALAKSIHDIQRVSQTIEFETKKSKEKKALKRSKKSYRTGKYEADDSPEEEGRVYENSLISWKCVVDRQQWYRCLDREYLHLKCFLLERFMHDVLFESSSSLLLRRFLGLD